MSLSVIRRIVKCAIAFSLSFVFFTHPLWHPESSVVQAQFVRPDAAAREVYLLLPNFPKENNYVRLDTGEVDGENTLLSRLISYHSVVKNRPLIYRLDWKLTLADYLGVNERLAAATYPGSSIFQENPLERDRAIIARLSRREREALVQALIRVFNPSAAQAPTFSPRPTTPPPASPPPAVRRAPDLPPPGAADLLK